MNRWRTVFHFGVFAIGFCLINYLLLSLIYIGNRHTNNAQTGKVNQIMAHTLDPEFIMFGPSTSEVGFDAPHFQEVTGLSSFNASIDGTPLRQNKALIEEYIDYSQNNKYLAIGISYFSFSNDSGPLTRPSIYFPHLGNEHMDAVFQNNVPDLHFRLKYIPGYALTQLSKVEFKNAALGWLNIIRNKELSTANLGFIAHHEAWQKDADVPPENFGSQAIIVSSDFIHQINELLAAARAKGFQIVLVQYPMQEEGQKLFSNYELLADTISNEIAQPDDIFLNLANHPVSQSKDYYYNNGHLNADGARIITTEIARQLGLLKNHASNSSPVEK